MGKKIDEVGKKKDCQQVKLWKKSIINHLYYVAVSTPREEEELREAKWVSLINHIHNIHQHDNDLYPSCEHEDLQGADREKEWIELGSKASVLLEEVLRSPNLISDVKRMSSSHQTSSLEAFHSLIIHYAP